MAYLLQVGDIFKAPSLATKCGYTVNWDTGEVDKRSLVVGEKGQVVTSIKKEKVIDGEVWRREEIITIERDATDSSRGYAEFVVTSALWGGGGMGHGLNDEYPDGWQVVAKRLSKDGQWDPEGEQVRFCQSSGYTTYLSDAKVVRKAVMEFVT